ncbi:Rqc2 family fibronectin-binding protein [Thermoflavimicrobium dichotomicum]|uniref:Rqc2 homolog RqcH n=1 Tax=Thermoflavimicrobium dichotomicum TaxID=46223 RepID=A0A1I3SU17_9BACL|nr:NFACT RNA binding domain-containing protein [Thermoflavimicrobium dichotomicum]SFJ62324.1 Predicted component of the ribosome quality control (RQC) complex, YloA/Tae2 family, contains fibronectin-binding (FbpA) and DUF814 domains [Thermoflavimicrobium dichotomicum]
MSFDGIVTRAIVHELNKILSGGRITKVYQPSDVEILLHIRSKGKNHRLLLSAHPAYPRIHFVEHQVDHPVEPPMFCMLLRKHCEGAIIESIEQVGMERIIHILFRTRNELGDEVIRCMVLEIMGRHSNFILLDPETGYIFDAIRRVTPAISQHRQVFPGATYTPPPEQNKQNPLDVDKNTFIAGFDYNRGQLDKQIVQRFTGIGPLIAREIVHRAGLGNRDQLWEAFQQVIELIRHHQYVPTIIHAEQKSVFSAIPLTHVHGEKRTYPTMSACLEAFYFGKAERDRIKQQTNDLMRLLQNEIDKNTKKISVLEKELHDAEKAETYRIYGELLTAYMHQIKRGDQEVRLINYYDPEAREIVIPLDPKLTPSANAQYYFKKYNKLKASKKWNEEQIKKAKEEITYLESVLVQLQNSTLREIEQIREELQEEGWLKTPTNDKKRRKKEVPAPMTVYSSSGTPILIGRNNKQNDYLTHQMASATDTWLHTKDIPGSHVVIRSKSYDETTLLEAAMLAAYFSKARESSQVPVDYTLIKYVRKPSGARPGFVIYDHQRTLFVTPDEEKVKKILFRKPPVQTGKH